MTDKFKAQQETFLKAVNGFGGNPPTFKFDSAHAKIILVEAPSMFIERLVESGAKLSLTRDGIIVYYYDTESL